MTNVATLAMSASTLATGQAFRMEAQPVASLRGFRLFLLHGSLSFSFFTILDVGAPRFIQRKVIFFKASPWKKLQGKVNVFHAKLVFVTSERLMFSDHQDLSRFLRGEGSVIMLLSAPCCVGHIEVN